MYLLDANVFIQAKNLYYGFDFCPAFRSWLEDAHLAERVYSVRGVGDELLAGVDALAMWAQARPETFFLQPDRATLPSLRATSQWAIGAGYEQTAVSTFLQVGDYYLVSQALALDFTVVTHEIAGNSRKKIKIPDACIGLGVRHMSPFQMLRAERARFVLG